MKVKLVNPNFTDNYVDNLLRYRGIPSLEQYKEPDPIEYLQDPIYLDNIRLGAALLKRVVKDKGNILLIVDSDVDGFTSSAIMYKYIKDMDTEASIDYWLHTGKQHGLQDHIDRLLSENKKYDLVILPDSSSNDLEYHNELSNIGLPCLVLDHHIADLEFSDNAVIINNQSSAQYYNKDLTGAGVVYQFCRFLDEQNGTHYAEKYIDLAALGIIADMGSMLSMENRCIVKKGLGLINNGFFHYLIEKQSYSITGSQYTSWSETLSKLNPISVAFYIVPMINALIRVGTESEKELLFTAFIDSDRMVECNKRGAKGTLEKASIEAARICTNARNRQNKIKDEAIERLEMQIFKEDLLENKVLFIKLEDDSIPPELNGLIAMGLSVKYKKPTIVARLGKDGVYKGSMRGLNESDLVSFKEFLTESNLFEFVQGHDNAAGAAIKEGNYEKFIEYANNALCDYDFDNNSYSINFERFGVDSDLYDLVTDIGKASDLWGQNNPTPVLYVHRILVSSANARIMGSKNDTIKIEYNGMNYIRFKASDLIGDLENKGSFAINVIGTANLNNWNGTITPQIFINDYEIIDDKSNLFEF